ncbi:MAG: spermidine/putrescine ABC transporter substrate-binding protein [Thiofilum sp.]|uniref:polyamine ABC transporter substrate-binding protein n=1 Tax=Thiofilum sp. TaxID=2212733 RepID=UPI0025CC10A5|nr:spermidine/putrescine ABC transporter substrate-binding protein [Thiofilum sp.]MBK8452736.1 spermidine/putrescine ABC transporter substrate-binding protein [Thiofilum sp.]
MKVWLYWCVSLVLVLSVSIKVAAETNPAFPEEKVIVYNWTNYIPASVLAAFTKETGIQVEYSNYSSSEIMYTRLKLLKGRGYDVIVPSSVLIARMQKEGLLQPLDHRLLPNLKHIDPSLMDQTFDPSNTYSVPYLWGSTGIAVNTEKITQPIQRWADLWQKQWRGQLLLTDDMRGVFQIALKANGQSTNTTDPDIIKQAYDRLSALMPNVKRIEANQPEQAFLSGEINIGVLWNGDAFQAQQRNNKIHYIYPQEGTDLWVDSFAIPAKTKNKLNAHRFIDYMLRPEVAALCVKELGYASANLSARALIDKYLLDNPIIFPPATVVKQAEFQKDVDEATKLYRLYWEKLKSGRL